MNHGKEYIGRKWKGQTIDDVCGSKFGPMAYFSSDLGYSWVYLNEIVEELDPVDNGAGRSLTSS